MSERQRVLEVVAENILALSDVGSRCVGIDGVDGAGKTMLADELAVMLTHRGARVIRASADGFHNPPAVRYRLGRSSPEGYFRDSYDYDRMRTMLLDPLGPGGNRRFRRACYDVAVERAVEMAEEYAEPGSILVFDGIFLHRPELRDRWDYSMFLHAGFDVSVSRMAQRDGGVPAPDAVANRRYVEGQRMYLAECMPRDYASIVIDNTNLDDPQLG